MARKKIIDFFELFSNGAVINLIRCNSRRIFVNIFHLFLEKKQLSYGENGRQVNNSKHEAMSMSNEEEKDIYPTNEEQNSIISIKKVKVHLSLSL